MTPVNNKSLLAFLFGQMEKLDEGLITPEVAREQANLTKEANKLMRFELDRVKTIMQLDAHNREFGKTRELRESESKAFS